MGQSWTDMARRLRAHALEVVGAVSVLLAARAGGVGEALPWWVLPALVLLAFAVSSAAYTWWHGPVRGPLLHVRTAAQLGTLAAAAYASGLGPALVAPFVLLGLVDTVRHAGADAYRTALGWGLTSLLVGQLLVAGGAVPSRLPAFEAHATAAVGAVLLALVGARVARLAASGERAREEAVHEASRTRALLAHASDMTLVIDDACITYQSPSTERVLGYAPDEVLGRRYLDLVHPDDRDHLVAFVRDLIATPGSTGRVTCRLFARDGRWVPVESSCRNLLDDPAIQGVVVNCRDVTERQELERALQYRAFHDELTGLPNRSLLLDRLRQAAARTRRRGATLALLYVDLDGFKPVNDTYGHVTGDAVLTTTARRLVEAVREADTVARLGGDEFAVLLECEEGVDEAARVAQRLLDAVRDPVEVEGRTVRVTASIGIALGDEVGGDAVDLLRNGDIAMYRAKRGSPGDYAVFHAAMHTDLADRLRLENEIGRAIERDEFVVHYQPIVRLDDARVIAVEALARWHHPEHGTLLPATFIPVAEQTGQIVAIGAAVMEQACDQLAHWRRELPGCGDLQVTVNVSMHQLLEADLPGEVADVLRRTELAPDGLVIELTESALAHDAERARHVLQRLKALGVHLALDDFGTGYSSLAHLHRFPVDVLKIDRSFVGSAAESAGGRAELARTMVELGRSLDLVTVAEGIEASDELDHFRQLGCPLGQGFLFARPADGPATRERLRTFPAPGPVHDLRAPAGIGD